MKGILGITGTPGTGKKSIAPIVADGLGVKCTSLNELARSYGLVEKGSGEVSVSRLRSKLGQEPPTGVVYGHLLPYVFPSSSIQKVVVLRCEPGVLKQRLLSRRYPMAKTLENVEAELIGVISSDAQDAFGKKMMEVDTTSTTPVEGASAVLSAIAKGGEKAPMIDWTLGYDSGAKLRFLLSAPR